MNRNSRFALASAVAAALVAGAPGAYAADIANATPTAIKGPECVDDPSSLFFAENVVPTEPPHPTLPIGHYYQIVRYLGDSVSSPVATDYGFLPQSYPWPPFRGQALTGLTVPEPRAVYQRASRSDATPDNSSAFQLHCYDAGSFINTWTFPRMAITGGGAHSIYGYSFDAGQLPPLYDADAGTDFVLQASLEIPWFASAPDPAAPPGIVPVGQAAFFAYFEDRRTGRTFALLLGVFDNRYATGDPTGSGFVAHDTVTPFVSTPIVAGSKYMTLSPYSAIFTGKTWTGLRFFRAHVTQADFHRMVGDVNAYCAANPGLRYCSSPAPGAPAYSTTVTDYVITDFGVLHEVFPQGDNANLSMGVHVYGLGAWNFR